MRARSGGWGGGVWVGSARGKKKAACAGYASHHRPHSYWYKWRGAILVDCYPIWSWEYETKDATSVRDELREQPAPELSCLKCPNDGVHVGEKSADGAKAKVLRWYDCPDCGYESPSRIVYDVER